MYQEVSKIIFEKSYTKCVGETFSRSFSKKSYPWIKSLKIYTVFLYSFFVVTQVEGYQKILKLCCRPLAFTSLKAFL